MKQIAMLAATILALSGAAWAQTGADHHPGPMAPPGPMGAPHTERPAPHGPGMPGAMPGSMGSDMGRMMDMMRERMAAETMDRAFQHIDGKLAYMGAELHITDAQQPQWTAFADAVRAAMPKLRQAYSQSMQPAAQPVPMPDQLEHQLAVLTAQLDAVRSIEAPAKALYAALSDEQKHAADEITEDHMLVHLLMP